ncbi:DUF3068 domain-containing protein [Nocardioides marmotae]|uniref:DUF3068 domain-containing protein n=1 Tax=Nocardioides marmotae TaxID=2663857 RepID=UPI0012B5B964|nr:DUF3068 domain-containing protein [Nocardioides marmotae]MBC9734621.1 DUF3068 domain-containing protein [Nocardioides marmotae]MTB85723.1 DUF3068 domain-containing protein [Nocardioides marmotae]
MRVIVGRVLLGLGAFLLVAGILGVAWAPGAVKKTPVEVDQKTDLTGTAERLDTSTGETRELEVKYTSITKSDTEASDDDTVYFKQATCLVEVDGETPDCVSDDDDRLISAGEETFATDRKTAMGVDGSELPDDVEPFEGLVNKWPFDAEKKDYEIYDNVIDEPVTARFERTDEINGLEVYIYTTETDRAPIDLGSDIDGLYTDRKEYSVDPRTGSIIKQAADQQRFLADGTQVLSLQMEYTDEEIDDNVIDAKDNIASIDLLTRTVPLVGFIGGALCVLAGIALILTGRRTKTQAGHTA